MIDLEKIKKGLLLTLISSIFWAFWTILVNIVDILNKQNDIVYLIIVESFAVLLFLPFFIRQVKKRDEEG